MPMISDLERLAALHESKAISDDEFAEAKRKVIRQGESPFPVQSTVSVTVQKPSEWKPFWGKVAIGCGVLGVVLTFYMNANTVPFGGILVLCAFQPLCFIGFPLGIYWINTAPTSLAAFKPMEPEPTTSPLAVMFGLIAFTLIAFTVAAITTR